MVIRVRPLFSAGESDSARVSCVSLASDTTLKLDSHPKDFTFDRIVGDGVDQVGRAPICRAAMSDLLRQNQFYATLLTTFLGVGRCLFVGGQTHY